MKAAENTEHACVVQVDVLPSARLGSAPFCCCIQKGFEQRLGWQQV
jgi:hypothetical protein